MLNKLLKEIVVITVGKQAELIADLLETDKHVNEFNIAKKLDLTINQTRNILYKISNFGLISSIRKKDKKKGWYTYFWKFEILKCLEFLKGILDKSKADIEGEIDVRSKNLFYICERCSIECDSEEALLKNFSCDECGDVFTVKDDSKFIKELKRHLDKIVSKLEAVHNELEKEKIKLGKKKDRELKKEEKLKLEKKAEAAEKRRIAREAKAKAEGKTIKKKVVKKKVAKVLKKKTSGKKKQVKKKKAVKKKGVKKVVKKVSKKKVVAKKKVVKKVVKKKAATPKSVSSKKKTSGKKKK